MNKWLNVYDINDKKRQCEDRIDHYTEYIDSYDQMQIALENNRKIYQIIDYCNKLIKEMSEITKILKDNNINTIVEYNQGNYRININGKYLYKKVII